MAGTLINNFNTVILKLFVDMKTSLNSLVARAQIYQLPTEPEQLSYEQGLFSEKLDITKPSSC